jgi:hypothetical protein
MKKPIQKKQKILRRPMIVCHKTEFGVALLKMTVFVLCPFLSLTPMGEGRNIDGFKKLVFYMPDQVWHDGKHWNVKSDSRITK